MPAFVQKSYQARAGQTDNAWYLVDGSGLVLGRLAAKVATILMGKHKPTYTPHVDTGDYVVLVNAERVRTTGTKAQRKQYQTFSGYPSGQRVIPFERLMRTHPDRVVRLAVRRMLPKNKLGRRMLSKLKIFRGPEHTHQAQCPVPLSL